MNETHVRVEQIVLLLTYHKYGMTASRSVPRNLTTRELNLKLPMGTTWPSPLDGLILLRQPLSTSMGRRSVPLGLPTLNDNKTQDENNK
jgi:hypothetical protein